MRIKVNFYKYTVVTLFLTACSQKVTPPAGSIYIKAQERPLITSQNGRFIKLDLKGIPLQNQSAIYQQKPWRCVLDTHHQLIWEVKTIDGLLQGKEHTYSWYQPDNGNNGGFSGYPHQGLCQQSRCDTYNYTKRINQLNLCGVGQWRLPTREELRTLVRYDVYYPGPTISTEFFPNTRSQFYWSSIPSANEQEGAWGIGFSFGYDYAYFKSDYGSVRLVYGPLK